MSISAAKSKNITSIPKKIIASKPVTTGNVASNSSNAKLKNSEVIKSKNNEVTKTKTTLTAKKPTTKVLLDDTTSKISKKNTKEVQQTSGYMFDYLNN